MKGIFSLLIALLLSACGGGGSDSDSSQPFGRLGDITVAGPPEALTLTWDPVPGAVRYYVYRSTDPNQRIDSYAAYADAGLVITDDPGVELDLSAVRKMVYFQVVAESRTRVDGPVLVAADLARRINPDDPSLADDHLTDLQWRRCPEGTAWSEGVCHGTPIEIPDVDARDTYGSSSLEWRAPTYSESIAFVRAGRSILPAGHRFSRAHSDAAKRNTERLMLAHERRYPPFYMLGSMGYGTAGLICSMGFEGIFSCFDAGDRDMRVTLVRDMPTSP